MDKCLGKGFPHAPHGLTVYSYWHFMKHEFDHAGFVETSTNAGHFRQSQDEKGEKGLHNRELEQD